MIQAYDVALSHERAELTGKIRDRVGRVIDSGVYLFGPEESQFESDFRDATGANHCIAVGSGTDAIRIALLAAKIGPGDEVLVPAVTFVATWLAVSSIGAVPVPVGSDYDHDGSTIDAFLMGPAACARAITESTKAIIPVHLYGHAADMFGLTALAERHDLALVEDCAQAHGLNTGDVRSSRLIRAYSFYPTKNLGAIGDAGAIVTNDPEIAERAAMFRNYGGKTKDDIRMVGFNSRMGEIQAAALNAKLHLVPEWNRRRRAIAHRYTEALIGQTQVSVPTVGPRATPVWHHFAVRSRQKTRLRELLSARGVGSGEHYPRAIATMPLYRESWGSHPTTADAQRLMDTTFTIPMGPYLTEAEQSYVIHSLIESSKEI